MPDRLKGKVAIVTGASSGLGRAIALAYSAEGAHVVCVDLREGSLFQSNADETRGTTHDRIREMGGQAIFVPTDVTSTEAVANAVARAVQEYGRLDIMVNNAGISLENAEPLPIWDVPIERWDRTQAVNSRGVFLGTKYAASQMLAQEAHPSGDRGWIINMASILGQVGLAAAASYCASKGLVVNLTRAAALDCAPHRIHVNSIGPGFTDTHMNAVTFGQPELTEMLTALHPFRGLGRPDDIAKAAVFLASEDAQWVTGVHLPVDGGYTAQ